MQKTKKSILKRVKVTSTGKFMHKSANHGHLLRRKTQKQKRRALQDKQFSIGFTKHIKSYVSVGL